MVIENPYAKKRRRNVGERSTQEKAVSHKSSTVDDSRNSPVSASIYSTGNGLNSFKHDKTNTYNDTPFWNRLPSSKARFKAASIVTVSELWQKIQTKIIVPTELSSIESYRTVGIVLRRIVHDDGSLSLLVGDSTDECLIANSSLAATMDVEELSPSMAHRPAEQEAAAPYTGLMSMTQVCEKKEPLEASKGKVSPFGSSIKGKKRSNADTNATSESSYLFCGKNEPDNLKESEPFSESYQTSSSLALNESLIDTSIVGDMALPLQLPKEISRFIEKTGNPDNCSHNNKSIKYSNSGPAPAQKTASLHSLVNVVLNNYHCDTLPIKENLDGHRDFNNVARLSSKPRKVRCIWVVIPNYSSFQHSCCGVDSLVMIIGELRPIRLRTLLVRGDRMSMESTTSDAGEPNDDDTRANKSHCRSDNAQFSSRADSGVVNAFRNVVVQEKATVVSLFYTGSPLVRSEQTGTKTIDFHKCQSEVIEKGNIDCSSEPMDDKAYYYVEARIVRDASGTNMVLYTQALLARRQMLSNLGIKS
jgi:hypothetical protein